MKEDDERRTSGPAPSTDSETQHEFFDKALADAGRWTRFSDPKALAALVILGLALANLLEYVRPLMHAHEAGSAFGWIATIAFWLAVVWAVVTVLVVILSLFPRVAPVQPAQVPLYFFGHIAAFASAAEYENEVRRRSARELESAVAAQAWEVARVARVKHIYAKRALQSVIVFLVCWAVARVGLALQ